MEIFPTTESLEFEKQRRLADDALIGIGNAWDHIQDLNSLGPGDPYYLSLLEGIKDHASEYGRALFKVAQATQGEERFLYIQGLQRMSLVLGQDAYQEVLGSVPTNILAVQELQRKAEEELPPESKYKKGAIHKIKNILGLLRNK